MEISDKIKEMRIKLNNDNIVKKEKMFEQNRTKKNISLTFNSLNVQIFEVTKNEKAKEFTEIIGEMPVFEYYLPFSLLPIFYFKGEEKFKIILSKLLKWDNN